MRLIDLFETSDGEKNELAHSQALEDTGFWGNAGAGALFIAKDTGRILFAHRSAAVEQPGTWGTWGGAIDAGESPTEAVKREAQEEAGLTVADEDIIPLYVFKHKSGFQYFNYIILVDGEFTPQLNWETQGYKWVDFGDWPQPLHFGPKDLLADTDSFETIKKLSNMVLGENAFINAFNGQLKAHPYGSTFGCYIKCVEDYKKKGLTTKRIFEAMNKLIKEEFIDSAIQLWLEQNYQLPTQENIRGYQVLINMDTTTQNNTISVKISSTQILSFTNMESMQANLNEMPNDIGTYFFLTLKEAENFALRFKLAPHSLNYTINTLSESLNEAFKQGSQSGVYNEKYLVKKINRFLRQKSPLTVIFHDHRYDYTVKDIKRAIHTGSQNRPGIKGDMDLIDRNGDRTIFSIKTERGTQWESADSYFGTKAKRVIAKLLADGEIVLRDRNDPSRIYTSLNNKPGIIYDSDPIAIQASKVEQKNVMFGDDINPPDGGCVIINTFNNSDFVLKGSILHINVKRIVIELADLDEKIWFFVRTDITRNPKDFLRGLRIIAVSDSRVGRNLRVGANGKVLSR